MYPFDHPAVERLIRLALQLIHGQALIEASGNISLGRVRDVAETGVDFISVGVLTHSTPAADLSMSVTCESGS